MATMLETQHNNSKKRRASKLDDSDDGKKRGRPRVEKNDESAADVCCSATLLTDAHRLTL